MSVRWARVAVLLSGFLSAPLACPGIEPGPSAECEKLGDKCRLPSGPLGVCDRVEAPGQPSRFSCVSQH